MLCQASALAAPQTRQLAAHAPWALSAAVRLVATCVMLVPISDALVTRSQPEHFSLLSIEQVPGPTPMYVSYGPPEFTTFSNSTTACQACIEFFPEKKDGGRFHSRLYEDEKGGVWAQTCRAGSCDFRDPQTQPVGGVIGKGVGPGGEPDGKTCITRDPVPWYADCEPIVMSAASTVNEVTRYCSYREQIFIPPPAKTASYFAGSKDNAWRRIGGSKEQCMETIEKQGSALMDTMTFCDSDLLALSGCCETVFDALTCVAETAKSNGLWGAEHGSIFSTFDEEGSKMLDTFAQYCVPLCQNTKEEFCEKNPSADICVSFEDCSGCTAAGGLWCPKLESCHCPGPDPPCIAPPVETPLGCLPKTKLKELRGGVGKKEKHKADLQNEKAEEAKEKEAEEALCKYHEFAQKWRKPED